jgi:hypothetical protein
MLRHGSGSAAQLSSENGRLTWSGRGAGDGNRTRMASLAGWGTLDGAHPADLLIEPASGIDPACLGRLLELRGRLAETVLVDLRADPAARSQYGTLFDAVDLLRVELVHRPHPSVDLVDVAAGRGRAARG